MIAAMAPVVGVVAASGPILPTHLLEAFPHAVLNVHASLLPRHRGASAVASSILAGDAVGATVMRVVREVDAGPVLGQARVPIRPLDTTGSLTSRIAEAGAALLVELLPRWCVARWTPRRRTRPWRRSRRASRRATASSTGRDPPSRHGVGSGHSSHGPSRRRPIEASRS
ncbi:MAG: formyltransferase family protein [Dehalococcoidia bacterium]